MSAGAKMGCFTLNWEIENFSIFLSKSGITLDSPYMKMVTPGRCEWGKLVVIFSGSKEMEFAVRSLESYKIEAELEVSFISSCAEISNALSTRDSAEHKVPKDAILDNSQAFLPGDTLTICCKMWKEAMEPEEMHVRTVLHRDNFLWDIEGFRTDRGQKCTTLIEKQGILFTMTLEGPEKKRYKFEIKNVGDVIVGGHVSFVSCTPSVLHYQASFYAFKYGTARDTWDMEFHEKGERYNNVTIQLDSIFAVHRKLEDPSGSLNNGLLQLYRQSLHSDATINADGKSFPVHKSILSTRSDVFRSMFEKEDTSEGRLGIVDVDDIDSDTVDRMLVFLYSDKLNRGINWEQASALYYAADKYAIFPLKKKCIDILKAGLASDNACSAVVLADRHADQELMRGVVDFIRDHNEVISSSDWEKLEESNLSLTSKITREILVKKRKLK